MSQCRTCVAWVRPSAFFFLALLCMLVFHSFSKMWSDKFFFCGPRVSDVRNHTKVDRIVIQCPKNTAQKRNQSRKWIPLISQAYMKHRIGCDFSKTFNVEKYFDQNVQAKCLQRFTLDIMEHIFHWLINFRGSALNNMPVTTQNIEIIITMWNLIKCVAWIRPR